MAEFAFELIKNLDYRTVGPSVLRSVVETVGAREAAVWLRTSPCEMTLNNAAEQTSDGVVEQAYPQGWTLEIERMGTGSECLFHGGSFVTRDYYAWLVENEEHNRATIEQTVANVAAAMRRFEFNEYRISLVGVALMDGDNLIGCLTALFRELDDNGVSRAVNTLRNMGRAISAMLPKSLLVERELKKKEEFERELERRNNELAEAIAQLKQARLAMAKGHEYEKERLGWNLHDNSNQLIAALSIHLHLARDACRAGNFEDACIELDEANRTVDDLAATTRDLIASLGSRRLLDDGLMAAISSTTEKMCCMNGFEYRLGQIGEERALADDKLLAVYRIVQEAVQNAVRHSQGSHIAIMVRWMKRALKVTVTDDGVGLDGGVIGKIVSSDHYGVQIMTARAEAVGGYSCFANLEDGGLRVETVIPY